MPKKWWWPDQPVWFLHLSEAECFRSLQSGLSDDCNLNLSSLNVIGPVGCQEVGGEHLSIGHSLGMILFNSLVPEEIVCCIYPCSVNDS